MKTQKFNLAPAQSNIEWTGRKVTGSHNGTIAITQGELILNDGQLTGGKIAVDTTSIKIDDITDPQTNAQFAGHLASDDFFSSQKFPEAQLDIISVKGKHVEAHLTIKGITHPVEFDAAIDVKGNELTANATIIVDRTLYDMKFRSGNFFTNLGDTLIFNEIELNVAVHATVEKKTVSVF